MDHIREEALAVVKSHPCAACFARRFEEQAQKEGRSREQVALGLTYTQFNVLVLILTIILISLLNNHQKVRRLDLMPDTMSLLLTASAGWRFRRLVRSCYHPAVTLLRFRLLQF